ncbi:hypothetical protein LZ30DRAFT_709042 [Colletotrichum cereale]|nr:hypothetical protein LZ30DRAFT_709042 [Colletotrichum cereale]
MQVALSRLKSDTIVKVPSQPLISCLKLPICYQILCRSVHGAVLGDRGELRLDLIDLVEGGDASSIGAVKHGGDRLKAGRSSHELGVLNLQDQGLVLRLPNLVNDVLDSLENGGGSRRGGAIVGLSHVENGSAQGVDNLVEQVAADKAFNGARGRGGDSDGGSAQGSEDELGLHDE